jgi:hypothetical protein
MSKIVHFMQDHINTTDVALKGTGGLIASVMLSAPSWLESIEATLRIASLLGSIAVAIFTCVVMYKKLTKTK